MELINESLEKLILRPYKPKDAESIVGWIKDERALRKWSSDRYGDYPITAEDINYKYLKCNGDCDEPDNFYPLTAVDENGPVGHLILRYTNKEKTIIRMEFKEVPMDEDIVFEIFGEKWKCIEMEKSDVDIRNFA